MSSLLLRGYSAFASGSHVSDWCDADKVTPEIAEFNVTPDKKKIRQSAEFLHREVVQVTITRQ